MPEKKTAGRRILEFSTILSLLAGIAVMLRVATVAEGNRDLAFAIIGASNFGQILVSTVLLMMPALVALFVLGGEVYLIVTLFFAPTLSARTALEGAAGIFLWGLAVALSSFFETAQGALYLELAYASVAVLGVLAVLLRAPIQRFMTFVLSSFQITEKNSRAGALAGRLIGFGAVLVVTVLVALPLVNLMFPSDVAWSPDEVLYLRNSSPYVARVLASDDKWTYTLIDAPRQLRVIATSNLLERDTCLDGSVKAMTAQLWDAHFTSGQLDYYPCSQILKFDDKFYQSHGGSAKAPNFP